MNIFMENLCYFTILLQNIFKIAILLEKKNPSSLDQIKSDKYFKNEIFVSLSYC